MEAHEYAKIEASKKYERYTIDALGCNKIKGANFLQRVEDGDGARALKECFELKVPQHINEYNERAEVRKLKKPFYQLIDLHEYSE
eukprot:12012285-Ditylum_brightwellii.AAC.1